MKFCIFTPTPQREELGGFLVANFLSYFPKENGLKFVTPETSENFTTFPRQGKKLITWNSLCGRLHVKNPRVRKMFCPQFWGRKWLCQFYGRLEKCALFLQEKPMSIKFLVLGGGGYFGFWGGGKCRFYFYGREDFSDSYKLWIRQNLEGGLSDVKILLSSEVPTP